MTMPENIPPYGAAQDPATTRLENLFIQLVKHRTEKPQEVTVVSARTPGEQFAVALVGSLMTVPLGGLVVMWLATYISFVPDIGYGEATATYVLAGWLFRGGFPTSWIKQRKVKDS